MSKIIKIIGQLYEIRSRKDGGNRIVIDCGNESIYGVMELQRLNSLGETNLGIAIVVINDSSPKAFEGPELNE